MQLPLLFERRDLRVQAFPRGLEPGMFPDQAVLFETYLAFEQTLLIAKGLQGNGSGGLTGQRRRFTLNHGQDLSRFDLL